MKKIRRDALVAAVPYLLQNSNFHENYENTQVYSNHTKLYQVTFA
jgi:hypothetical protein